MSETAQKAKHAYVPTTNTSVEKMEESTRWFWETVFEHTQYKLVDFSRLVIEFYTDSDDGSDCRVYAVWVTKEEKRVITTFTVDASWGPSGVAFFECVN